MICGGSLVTLCLASPWWDRLNRCVQTAAKWWELISLESKVDSGGVRNDQMETKGQSGVGGGCVVCFRWLAVCWLPGWGEGVTSSCLHLCLETQRGLCPVTMGLRDQCLCPLCVCVCVCVWESVWGRGGAPSHTQADWLRPHLTVESTGAGSHVGP